MAFVVSSSANTLCVPMYQELKAIAPNLSLRQFEVLFLLISGRSEKQIAIELGLSTHTVHSYTKKLHVLYGASSRGELLALIWGKVREYEQEQLAAARQQLLVEQERLLVERQLVTVERAKLAEQLIRLSKNKPNEQPAL